jgi:hypothetical protein
MLLLIQIVRYCVTRCCAAARFPVALLSLRALGGAL